MRRVLLAWLLLSVPAVAAAQLPSPPPQVEDGTRVDRHPSVTFPNGVLTYTDVPYWAPIGYRALTLDLYLPPATSRRSPAGFPLVVQVHGGGWMYGDKRTSSPFVDWPAVLASLAGKGYVVAAIDYRLSSEARFPLPIEDVKAAIRWLRLNAGLYGIDQARAVVWGESAGAYLAGLTAVSCGVAALEPKQIRNIFGVTSEVTTPKASDCVQGAVTWYGVFNMTTIQEQARQAHALSRDERDAPEWRLLGCFASQCRPAQLVAASPVTYVDKSDPPMLLIVGSDDTTVPTRQTLEMAEKLESAAVKHEVIVLPGVNHNFLGKTRDATRDANLKALGATFQFIDETIGTRTPETR
jgi:acetyl esterase/lipase